MSLVGTGDTTPVYCKFYLLHVFRIDILIAIIATITGIFFLARYKLKHQLLFFLVSLIVESVGFYYSFHKKNNVLIFNIYSVFQFAYVLFIYTKLFQDKIIKLLLIALPLLCFINIFFIQGSQIFHTYTFMLSAMTIIILSISFLWKLFSLGRVENIFKNANFWFAIGFLLYFTGNLSVIGIINYIATLPKYLIHLSRSLLVFVNTITYIFLFLSMIFYKSKFTHEKGIITT